MRSGVAAVWNWMGWNDMSRKGGIGGQEVVYVCKSGVEWSTMVTKVNKRWFMWIFGAVG